MKSEMKKDELEILENRKKLQSLKYKISYLQGELMNWKVVLKNSLRMQHRETKGQTKLKHVEEAIN